MRRSLKLRSVWSTKILYIVVILASGIAEGQTASVVNGIILQNQSTYAKIVPFGIVNVCISSSATCSTGNATIYTDSTGSVVKPQPVVADANGNYSYYISQGCFTEQSSSPSGLYPFVRTVCSGGGGGSAVSFVKVPGIATIQATVAGVGGIAGVTPVWVEPTHSGSDPGPCPMTNPGAVTAGVGCLTWAQSNTAVTDFRFPGYVTYFNPPATFSNFYSGEFLRSVFTQSNITGAHQGSLYAHATYLSGGINICQYGYCHLPWQVPLEVHGFSYTPGNMQSLVTWCEKHAPGDCLGGYFQVVNATAGRNAGGAEGAEGISILATQATVEYAGTLSAASATQATVTPSQGEGMQTVGSWLVDTSGTDINTGTISGINNNSGTAPPTVSFAAGPTFTAVTVNTTLGTAVSAPGVATVTPAAMTNISVGSHLFIADPKDSEIVTVTGTTGSTFTANFAWPHQSTALVTGGGLVGYCFDPHADDATQAIYAFSVSPITGTLHYVLPIVRNTTSTVDLWISNPSLGYAGYGGQAPSGGATYDIWPCWRVTSAADPVQTAELSDTLTLEANGLTPSVSDSVFNAHYFDNWTSGGQTTVQGFFPRLSGGQAAFFHNYAYYGNPGGSTWRGFYYQNNAPASVMSVLGYPRLFVADPNWGAILSFDSTPHGAVISDLGDTADTLQIVAKAATKIGRLDADPVNERFHIWTPSGGGQDVFLDWYDGNITSSGGVGTFGTVSTPNLAATGGQANLTQVGTPAGPFGTYGNLLEYSQFDSGLSSPWAYQCDHGTFTANTTDVTDPLGGNTALKMVTAASGSSCAAYPVTGIEQPLTGLTNGGVYTGSVWVQSAVGGELFNMQIVGGGTCVLTLTTSWQRMSCPSTVVSTSGQAQFFLQNYPSHTVYLWGAQVEHAGSVGAYIHTTSAPITGTGLYTTGQIVSTLPTGTAPFSVASTTPSNLNISGNAATATALAATPGSATGQAVCWKASGVLGYCSSVVGAGGGCTCN